jgi:hypothetical protein
MTKNLFLSLFSVIAINVSLFGQTSVLSHPDNDPYSNPVILSHYSFDKLQSIQAKDSVKFNTIVYYYTKSFIVEKIDCVECISTDLSTFDISKYEYLRKRTERFTRDFPKQGFKITLLSIDEQEYKLPYQLLPQ